MNKKKILLLAVLFVAVAGVTLAPASATLKVPNKYKTKTITNTYYPSDSEYYEGEYVWSPRYGKFSNPYIHETYQESKTKLTYNIYNIMETNIIILMSNVLK